MSAHRHHHHDHGELRPLPVQVRRILAGAVALVILAGVLGMVLLRPSGSVEVPAVFGGQTDLVNGTVVEEDSGPCPSADLALEGDPGLSGEDDPEASMEPLDDCTAVLIEVTSGPDKGEDIILESFAGVGTVELENGDKIVMNRLPLADGAPITSQYQFADYQRRLPLLVLFLLFAVAVIALGGLQGVRALLGALISLVVIVRFILPAIIDGRSPVAVALVGAVVIMVVALFLSHGVNTLTTSALLGTVASLLLTGALAGVFVALTKITGLASEEAGMLQVASETINLQGIVLGGIIIGSLGVLDDVTVTQSSVVFELAHANPELSRGELFRRSLRVGRDHIASTTNTLVLAYAGAALPLLILFSQTGAGLANVLNGEVVAIEIVRTLVGSIGLVASVPITTALAAFLARGGTAEPEAAVAS